MGRTIESQESIWGGSVSEGGSGLVLQPFSASRQLSTRCCARCGGLLVTEWYYDLHYTGEHKVEPLRCVQCGHRVDPVILQNQIRLPVMRHSVQQVRHRDSLETDTFAQKA
jgi:DNA-directed RNA polymerase subunit RPC12/RpoP